MFLLTLMIDHPLFHLIIICAGLADRNQSPPLASHQGPASGQIKSRVSAHPSLISLKDQETQNCEGVIAVSGAPEEDESPGDADH